MYHLSREVVKSAALAVILLVASACAERPDAPAAVDRLVEENHKAAEALVQAAREAAAAAGEQAHDAAHAARNAYEDAAGSEPGGR